MKENIISIWNVNKNFNQIVKKFTSFLMAFILVFSLFSLESSVVMAASLKTPKIKSVTTRSSTSITVKWKKVSGVSGYIIYQKKDGGKYKKLAAIDDSSDTSCTVKDLSSATKYTYKVSSYKIKNNKKTYSSKSTAKSTYTKPVAPRKISATAKSTSSIKLNWKKVSRADGYTIYRKSGSDYKRIATIKSGSTSTYTNNYLKASKKYKYIVRAYCEANGKKIYSEKSEIVSATTKSSAQKIYSTPTGKRYHYDVQCGGKNSRETTFERAKSIGLTPCQKCAQ